MQAMRAELLLPWLYFMGISSGDFSDASGLSASTIGRLKEVWQDVMECWKRSDLSAGRSIYFWVEQSWCEAPLDLKRRGLGVGPEPVTGDAKPYMIPEDLE